MSCGFGLGNPDMVQRLLVVMAAMVATWGSIIHVWRDRGVGGCGGWQV